MLQSRKVTGTEKPAVSSGFLSGAYRDRTGDLGLENRAQTFAPVRAGSLSGLAKPFRFRGVRPRPHPNEHPLRDIADTRLATSAALRQLRHRFSRPSSVRLAYIASVTLGLAWRA